MQEVTDVVVELESTARGEERFDIASTTLPTHGVVLNAGKHPEEGHLQGGEVIERPTRSPWTETAEMEDGIDLPSPSIVIVSGADSDEVLEPCTRQPWIHRLSALGQTFDRVRTSSEFVSTASAIESCSKVGSAHPLPFPIVHIWTRELRRKPVEIDESPRQRRTTVEEIEELAATLGMPEQDDRIGADRLDRGEMVAHIGGPSVEVGVLGIAVTARIPSDDSPTGVGDHRSEDVERSREVETTVHHCDDRGVRGSPFIHCQSKSAALDPTSAIGGSGPGELASQVVIRHEREPRSVAPMA